MRSMPKAITRIIRKNSVFAVTGLAFSIAGLVCFVITGVKTVQDIRETLTVALEEYDENH